MASRSRLPGVRLPLVDYLAMACKDYDSTVVIAVMHCPHRTIWVLKLSLVVEIQAFL